MYQVTPPAELITFGYYYKKCYFGICNQTYVFHVEGRHRASFGQPPGSDKLPHPAPVQVTLGQAAPAHLCRHTSALVLDGGTSVWLNTPGTIALPTPKLSLR